MSKIFFCPSHYFPIFTARKQRQNSLKYNIHNKQPPKLCTYPKPMKFG
nr:MAG TPA: hypothetical protein [Caudoviricetes sp.]